MTGNLLGSPQQSAPFELTGIAEAIDADPGRASCAVQASGVAHCWGDVYDFANGTSRGDGSATADENTPTKVALFSDFKKVRIGRTTGCGLRANGEIWCWGSDDNLALGDGGGPQSSGVPVRAGSESDYIDVGVGGEGSEFACGLRSVGQVMCWGHDMQGKLGDGGAEVNRDVPTPTLGPPGAMALSVGRTGACALDAMGAAYCWGDNTRGQLGTNDVAPRSSPTAVATAARFVAISTFEQHTCALTAAGQLWCWGWNTWGQLGVADFADRLVPTLVTAPTAVQVAVGSANTYLRTAAGEVYSFGAQNEGALGRPGGLDSPVPILVDGLSGVLFVNAETDFGAIVIAR